MRLGNFILRDMELILERWELFASTYLPPAAHMSSLSVRGHLSEILEAIVADLQNPHTRSEQAAKSMGLAVSAPGAPLTAAQAHALARVESGFDIAQFSAEYRALRWSIGTLAAKESRTVRARMRVAPLASVAVNAR